MTDVSDVEHALQAKPPLRAITAYKFLQELKPLEQIVDGLPIGRGRLTSITGPTGHGKTTIAALLQTSFVRGLDFAGREVSQGAVIACIGENPEDWGLHSLATMQEQSLEPKDFRQLLVIPEIFNFDAEWDRLALMAAELTPAELVAIFVDTSAAYFSGDDDNNNVQAGAYARTLRALTELPGGPAVIALCHPVKNATRDSLLPRGGGAFLAEVDANLTVWRDDAGIVTLHWAGKIRGPNFDPIKFQLKPRQIDGYLDAKGRAVSSAVAVHIRDEQAEQLEDKALDDENRLLVAMQRKPGASVADLAIAGGFTNGLCKPQKSRVHRLLERLQQQGLAKRSRTGAWELTRKGQDEANSLP